MYTTKQSTIDPQYISKKESKRDAIEKESMNQTQKLKTALNNS